MGSRVGTARRGSVKVGVVVAAAFFGVFTPGVGPLSAAAQEQPDNPPPPVWAPQGAIDGPPPDSKGPDKVYLNRVTCISPSSTEKNIAVGDLLKNGPWAQRFLRLKEVQQLIREKSKVGKVGVMDNGDPIKVAVIDTGVTKHPFFQNRVKPGGDYVEKDGKGKDGLLDCDGHGTQVAGIIAGNPDNVDIGFIGVAPDAQIISIRQSSQNYSEKTKDEIADDREEAKLKREAAEQKAESERLAKEAAAKNAELEAKLDRERQRNDEDDKKDSTSSSAQGAQPPADPRAQESTSGAGNLGTLSEAIVRAVKAKVDVINMSVDACRPAELGLKPNDDEAKVRAAIKYAADNDVVVVVAAGNSASPDSGGGCLQNDVRLPADPRIPNPDQPRTIVTPPWFAADGDLLAVAAIQKDGSVAPFSMRGPWVSVAAPGTEIISLDPAGTNAIVNVTFNGTNEKGEFIQGTSFAAPYVAGLAVLVRQMHPKLDARQIIDRIQKTAQHPGASDGHDQFVGHGVIDPMAAVAAELPEEMGIQPAKDRELPSDMPSLAGPDRTPMIVALAASGGGIAALLITLFVVRTVRRRDPEK